MTEIGKVTKIDGERITIQCKPSAACHSCNSGMCEVKDRELTARNSRKIMLSEGDYAEIFLPSSQILVAGFQVLIMPLILFFLFYFTAKLGFGVTKEGFLVLIGLVGLLIGFLVTYRIGRSNAGLPEVVKKLDENDLREALVVTDGPRGSAGL